MKKLWIKLFGEEDDTFGDEFYRFLRVYSLFILAVLILPLLLTRNFLSFSFFDFTKTGNIGDTIGGITSPFIGIAAATLTFLAFWVQYKANEQLKKDLKKERFENKFFEMLSLHKSNVNELNIANKVHGRKCFVKLFYELRCIYQIVEDFAFSTSKKDKIEYDYSEINLMSFSYRICELKVEKRVSQCHKKF